MFLAKEEVSIITISNGKIDTEVQGSSTTLNDLIEWAAGEEGEMLDINEIAAIRRTYQNNDGTIGVEDIQQKEFFLMVAEHIDNVNSDHSQKQSYSLPE